MLAAARSMRGNDPAMNSLRELILSNPPSALAAAGLVIGFAFGVLAASANFCVMGAVSDWRTFNDKGRLGAAALAAATAIVLTQALHQSGTIDVSRSMYLSPRLNWAGALLGGLTFGYGMVLAGGCASRNLVRAGGGDIRSLVTLLALSVAAFAAIGGILGPFRTWLDASTAIDTVRLGLNGQSLADVAAAAGLTGASARAIAGLALALPLIWFAFGPARILTTPLNIAAGLGVGVLVAAGWLITGLAYDDMAVHPVIPTSLSFVRPVGDAIDWIQHSTALGLPGFGAASVFGVLLGSFTAATARGKLALSGFAGNGDLMRHLTGAGLMGLGGVLGLGCSIGQGITGLSTLAIHSVLASSAILAGAVFALRRMEQRLT
jgi:uncharacterized protein